MISEHLPRKLPRDSVQRDWRADARFGAGLLPIGFKAPLRANLLGRPAAGAVLRVDNLVGGLARSATEILEAPPLKKPGTAIEAAAKQADSGIALTRARAAALLGRARRLARGN